MKRKIITCDVCSKDITHDNKRYKFKMYESTYVNQEESDHNKWNRLDMCEECWKYFLADVRNVRKKMSEED